MDQQTLRLTYDGTYDWAAALSFLSRRAIDGVEETTSRVYRRTVRLDGLAATLEVSPDEAGGALVATLRGPLAADPGGTIPRLRCMFDLDADIGAISAALARDPSMALLVGVRPTLRVFGGWDGFEVAARSVIGQQVSVARARRLNGVLVERCGSDMNHAPDYTLRRLFPTPSEVVEADLSAMGMPGARVATLKAVAAAAIADPRLFERAGSLEQTLARLRTVRGIGDWTAHYIAMRACREPDAFPASDVGLLRGAAGLSGRRPTAAELTARAEAWRPWRAYAAHQLWAADHSAELLACPR